MNIFSVTDDLMTQQAIAVKLSVMTPVQCRAARVLLGWDQSRLAKAAGMGLTTLVDFEKSRRVLSDEKVQDIRLALENAGIMLIGEQGVTRRADKAGV